MPCCFSSSSYSWTAVRQGKLGYQCSSSTDSMVHTHASLVMLRPMACPQARGHCATTTQLSAAVLAHPPHQWRSVQPHPLQQPTSWVQSTVHHMDQQRCHPHQVHPQCQLLQRPCPRQHQHQDHQQVQEQQQEPKGPRPACNPACRQTTIGRCRRHGMQQLRRRIGGWTAAPWRSCEPRCAAGPSRPAACMTPARAPASTQGRVAASQRHLRGTPLTCMAVRPAVVGVGAAAALVAPWWQQRWWVAQPWGRRGCGPATPAPCASCTAGGSTAGSSWSSATSR
jgi:hypothetical protein